MKKPDFNTVTEFEKKLAEFFGAKYAVAVDSATHGIELCLRMLNATYISSPRHTYLSIPMLANKLGIELIWRNEGWENHYIVFSGQEGTVIDAAVLWKKDSYVPRTFMCVSFQYQKHLSLGRGGVILCDSITAATELKKMSYDGRLPELPWRRQDIDTIGYHYYMTPDTAQLGLDKLQAAIDSEPRKWNIEDWPDLTQMTVFKK